MIQDLVVYLSGWVPGGLWLLGGALVFFCLIWWSAWTGTRFWSRKRLVRFTIQGWVIIILLYSVWWITDPPPHIPIRTFVICDIPDSSVENTWKIRGIADLIERRLSFSSKSFTLIHTDFAPSLMGINRKTSQLDSLAALNRISWIIAVSATNENTLQAAIYRRSGDEYALKATVPIPEGAFVYSAVSLAEQVALEMGDKHPEKTWQPLLPTLSEADVHDFYNAVLLRETGSLDSASVLLDSLRTKHPNWSLAFKESVTSWKKDEKNSHYEEIGDALLTVVTLESDDAEAYRMMGLYFLEYRRWQEAESALKLSLHYNQDDPQVFFFLSRLSDARLATLSWETSDRLLLHALHLSPGYEKARIALSKWLMAERKPRDAVKRLKEGLRIDPASLPLMLALSAGYIELGDYPEAEKVCNEMLSLDPRYARALYNLGIALIWQERYDEAIAVLDSSLHNGGTKDNLYYKGIAYQRKGDFEAAIDCYQRRYAIPNSASDRTAVASRERIRDLQKAMARMDSTASSTSEADSVDTGEGR